MPTRMLRDGILTSDRVNALSERAELFYRRLMNVVDDYGRFPANPMLLRASCYPLKLDTVKEDAIGRYLTECVEAQLVRVYEVCGKTYLLLLDFGQRIQTKAKYPAPISDLPESTEIHGNLPEKTARGGVGVEGALTSSNELVGESASDSPPPPCPVQKIVELYHAKLPELPRLEKLTDTRAGHIRQRWREDMPTLDSWEKYFQDIRGSPFLMGRAAASNGRKPFIADLGWLTKPENFAKVAERKYHR